MSLKVFSILLVSIGLAAIAFVFMRLHPPKTMTLAAGPENGGYSQIAKKYREILEQDGIKLEIVHTGGSVENADLIGRGEVDAAILQAGIDVADPDVEAIGTVFYEPMSFLARSGIDIPENPALWQGFRISSGSDGSGTSSAFRDFQRAVGLDPAANTQLSLTYEDAIAAIADKSIDIAVFVAPIDSPYLKSAYGQIWVRVVPLQYIDAISRRLEYATTVQIPAGAISLRPVVPPRPYPVIALAARLAVAGDLHPALVNRLTMAAISIHGTRGLISDPETFPSVEGTELTVNNVARNLIIEGPTTWHNWLPYWMAAQLNRILLLLLPVVFILVPLLRSLPAVYGYFMGWRVWQNYPEIRKIEEELDGVTNPEKLDRINDRLADLDRHLSQLRLPSAHRRSSYDARLHIELVRKRLIERRSELAQT